MRFVLALTLTVGVAAAQSDQPRSAGSPGAPVTLDVVAQDHKGQPLATLTPADFAVIEQNVGVAVDGARFVRATGAWPDGTPPPLIESAQDEQAAATDSTRLIAIFLDEFHVAPGPRADQVRDDLVRFVEQDLGPADLVVVLKPLDSILNIRLSRDRASAVREIQSFAPRLGDFTARTAFERNYIAGDPARVSGARAQITASALDAIASHLGRFSPSRKTMIVVSEGFARTGRRRSDEFLPSLDTVARSANRAGVAIYPIDPYDTVKQEAGPANQTEVGPDDHAPFRRALESLASLTGGRLTADAADVSAGLRQTIVDASGYYVLTLSRPGMPRDGRMHALDIGVRPKGITVHARAGYWAPSNDEETRINAIERLSPAIPYASRIARRTSPLIRPWFGMARADDGTTRVSFVWEAAPRVPGERGVSVRPARLKLSVITLDGAPVFSGVVLPANGGVGSTIAAETTQASFESPAGRLLVQMDIEDIAARVVDHDVRDLIVGGFPGPVTLGTAEVLRARTAREFQTLSADPNATPVASREFSRAERLLVRVPVFAQSGPTTMTARIGSALHGGGGSTRELPVSLMPSSSSRYQIDVPLAALAVGAYSIEVIATTPQGDARESISFRITP